MCDTGFCTDDEPRRYESDAAIDHDDEASHAEEQRRLDAAANDPAVVDWARRLNPWASGI